MIKYFIILLSLHAALAGSVLGRDIDLDRIYVKNNSPQASRLMAAKLDAYAVAASRFVVRDVIFADWISGQEIIYIRELPETNIIYCYNRHRQDHREISRIHGTVTACLLGSDGRYLFLKILSTEKSRIPASSRVIVDIAARRITTDKTPFPFLDFTLSSSGGIFFETPEGITEFSPDTGTMKLTIPRKRYAHLFDGKNPVMMHLAPNRKNALLVSGSGGQYSAFLMDEKAVTRFDDITSATELFWLSNNELIYRSGYTGEYYVSIFNLSKASRTRVNSGSLNTNLCIPRHGGPVSLLINQVITLYNTVDRSLFLTGLEGEDVRFSPDGSHFLSLLYGRLFISRTEAVRVRNRELIKNAMVVVSLYKNIASDAALWENDYSLTYVRKKIGTYEQFTGAR